MSENNESLIDQSIFNEARSIMKEKFPRILGYYFEDMENYLLAISQGLQDKQSMVIVSAAHTMKSSSYQLGAVALSHQAALLESLAKQLSVDGEKWTALKAETSKVEDIYKASKKILQLLST